MIATVESKDWHHTRAVILGTPHPHTPGLRAERVLSSVVNRDRKGELYATMKVLYRAEAK